MNKIPFAIIVILALWPLNQRNAAFSQDPKASPGRSKKSTMEALKKEAQSKDKKKVVLAKKALKEELRIVIESLRKALKKGDKTLSLNIGRGLLPTVKLARKAFRESVTKADFDKLAEFYKKTIPSDDASISRVLQVSSVYTELVLHQASGQQLRDYKVGSKAWYHFPGGCKRLAKSHLRSDLLFYEVEFRKPGSKRSIKYHLFFWNGQGWTMLGPVWRLFH
jgi:hypothetical protein